MRTALSVMCCICATVRYSMHMPRKTADADARELLLSPEEQSRHALTVQALLARNAMLEILETAREEQGLTKADVAARAGLEASSVRRLLTSQTANPTTENAFRLMAAMGIGLEATLPSGERVRLVDARPTKAQKTKRAAVAA
jgi:DNA-binding phage protein